MLVIITNSSTLASSVLESFHSDPALHIYGVQLFCKNLSLFLQREVCFWQRFQASQISLDFLLWQEL